MSKLKNIITKNAPSAIGAYSQGVRAGSFIFISGQIPLDPSTMEVVSDLFEKREDGFPLLSERDESTVTPGMFLCGPSVRHDDHDFCFIYKYRQRFAIVAEAIASSFDLPTEEFIETYKGWGMYLDDLSCCGQECLTC